jgi:hypothetical protein
MVSSHDAQKFCELAAATSGCFDLTIMLPVITRAARSRAIRVSSPKRSLCGLVGIGSLTSIQASIPLSERLCIKRIITPGVCNSVEVTFKKLYWKALQQNQILISLI